MAILRSVHPFPARMAPEIALAECQALPRGAVVLDPMAGSGTVLHAASVHHLQAIGRDLDPLAVLISRVTTTPVDVAAVRGLAQQVHKEAQARHCGKVALPWIDLDEETRRFVDYWFAPAQQCQLRRLSAVLTGMDDPTADVLRIALSRIIVTKSGGASLASDTSHSRPHRTRGTNDYDVFAGFTTSVARLAEYLEEHPPAGNTQVSLGDARDLSDLAPASVDALVTSPPYLNAIDYLRGHRLSLVWLGCTVRQTRDWRAASIGAERGLESATGGDAPAAAALYALTTLPERLCRIVDRYVVDMRAMLLAARRVLRPDAPAVLVVGNSSLRGVYLDNASAIRELARLLGYRLVSERIRPLPANHRYLPPPNAVQSKGLDNRMRQETVLKLLAPGDSAPC